MCLLSKLGAKELTDKIAKGYSFEKLDQIFPMFVKYWIYGCFMEVDEMNVQAVINNVSFPKTVSELEYIVYESGSFDIEYLLEEEEVDWTMPKWAMVNDIVFFYHAKTAIQRIRHIELELQKEEGVCDSKLIEAIRIAKELYDLFGGKIFAIGKVKGRPYIDDGAWHEEVHWSSTVYATIDDIYFLENPIPIEKFSDFIYISRQSAITPVLGSDFEQLKRMIMISNQVPDYLVKSSAIPVPLKDINKDNWLKLSNQFRRTFYLEIQFRKFYVDYFLREIGDFKTFFAECSCYKKEKMTGYVDNCIKLNELYCFVEVKLNINAEQHLFDQLGKYCNVEKAKIKNEWIYAKDILQGYVIVIDTECINIFSASDNTMTRIQELDGITNKDDLRIVRNKLIDYIWHTPQN